MGPRSRHTAQEGDHFCLLEMNVVWCEKCKSVPEQQQKDLMKMLEETGTKVSISTVKRVLYWHNLKGRSARKKPLLQNHHKNARLRFATAHEDKDHTFWRNVLWSEETKMELFGHNDRGYMWRKRKRLANRSTPSQPWSTGMAASCCGGALLQKGLVHFIK